MLALEPQLTSLEPNSFSFREVGIWVATTNKKNALGLLFTIH